MAKFSKIILSVLFCTAVVWASGIVEDSKKRFVLDDVVLDTSISNCIDEKGNTVEGFSFSPENASYKNGNGVPFRNYRVAIPSDKKPFVSISDVKTIPLNKNYCKNISLKFENLNVSAPFLKDGLWMVDVNVPLYEKSGASILLRKSFRLNIEFEAVAGVRVNPGERAVSRVVNPKAAARFGVIQDGYRRALRRTAANNESDVHFLAEFVVGERNVISQSDDGLFAVDFSSIQNAMRSVNRQSELIGIPINKIRLYGANPDTMTAMVPSSEFLTPNQLFQMPIEIRDNTHNGIFDEGDSIIFVGYGSEIWKRCDSEDSLYVNGKMDYFHSNSPYSFYQHFVFGWSESGEGLRMTYLKEPSKNGKKVDWMRYIRVEKDADLIDAYFGKSLEWDRFTGKEWFWKWHHRKDTTVISNNELSLSGVNISNLKNMVNDGRQYVAVSYFPQRSTYESHVENTDDQIANKYISSYSYTERMSKIKFNFSVNGNVVPDTLMPGNSFRLTNPGLKSSGNTYSLTMLPNEVQYDRFDGFTIAYQWNPVIDSCEWLLPGAVSGVIEIPVSGSNIQVMKFVNFKPVGLLNLKNGIAKDSVSAKDDVRYFAYKMNKYRSSVSVKSWPSPLSGQLSNLSRINGETEYLIISPEEFLSSSISLAKFRSSASAVRPLSTTVVSLEDIYRAYTGGSLSPMAIRNYIAYAHNVCPSLKYVLLVGIGHYDYRGMNTSLFKSFIPPYELEDAMTEDFYAALDSGEMVRYGKRYDLDVAVGRLPVSTVFELENYIKKAKDYEQLGVFDNSSWRSNIILAADDGKNGNNADGSKHTYDTEAIDVLLSKNESYQWNVKKLYLINYSYDAAGQKKDAADDIINYLNQGALITTYYGHGSQTDWAGEGLMKVSYIPKLNNEKRYTILNSFSCSVGRFDDGKTITLAEKFVLAKNAGAIASIGASRETFAGENKRLGTNVLINALDSNDHALFGDAYIKAKNIANAMVDDGEKYGSDRYNDEHYVFFGEPVLSMPKSKRKMVIETKLDTIKALDKMYISGTVSGMSDGFVHLLFREGKYLKNLSYQIPGNDDSISVSYNGSLIFSEEVPIKNGRFETEFITPRNINFGDTAAEFNAWAYSSKNSEVARYWKGGLKISGMSNYADSIDDHLPPSIKIRSCRSGEASDFSDGQTVKIQLPACFSISIDDSTALDYHEQPDEGISYEILGIENQSHPQIFVTQTSKHASFQKNFNAEVYPVGTYIFVVRAKDVLGNLSIKTLNLEIDENFGNGLIDVFNAPNPVGKKGTYFYFKNLSSSQSSTVNIFIYNQNGRLVKVIKNVVSGATHWDGRDNFGRKLANGLYHYVIRCEIPASGTTKKKTFTKKQKLLISR